MFDYDYDEYEDDEDDDDEDEVDQTSESVERRERQIDTVEALEDKFVAVAQSLDRQLRCAPNVGEPQPLRIIQDLAALLDAHERLDVLEEAFYYEDDPVDGCESADITVLRAQIGGQLDRLRAALGADDVSDDAEAAPT